MTKVCFLRCGCSRMIKQQKSDDDTKKRASLFFYTEEYFKTIIQQQNYRLASFLYGKIWIGEKCCGSPACVFSFCFNRKFLENIRFKEENLKILLNEIEIKHASFERLLSTWQSLKLHSKLGGPLLKKVLDQKLPNNFADIT